MNFFLNTTGIYLRRVKTIFQIFHNMHVDCYNKFEINNDENKNKTFTFSEYVIEIINSCLSA